MWNDTFRRLDIDIASGGRVITVTALYGTQSRIKLVADIELKIGEGDAHASFSVSMTPEEMELLAEQLLQAAEWQRDLIKRLDAHNAAMGVIAEGETRQQEDA